MDSEEDCPPNVRLLVDDIPKVHIKRNSIRPTSSPHVSPENIPSTSGAQLSSKPNDSMRKNDEDQQQNNQNIKDDDPSVSDWVCGGPVGSKGAVLVFRSCVLASKTPSMESTNKSVGNNTGTAILLNKAKNMAKRLVAEPTSFNVRPKAIMHDVMETFGNTNKYTGNAFVVKHVSETDVRGGAEAGEESGEHRRDIVDVLNDLEKITLKKNINIENTTANIKPTEKSNPPKAQTLPKTKRTSKSKQKNVIETQRPPSPSGSEDSEHMLVKTIDSIKVLESNNMPARILNVTYRLVNTETKLLHRLLQAHGLVEGPPESKDYNLMWSGLHPKPDVLRSLSPYQRVNHFPRSYELTRKDKLYKNIEKMQYFRGFKNFDFIPTTFLMPIEYKELCSTHFRTKGPWIVKPAASSRGRGIYIVNSPEQIPKGENVVVAKYIDKPLLVGGHKCDLRLYVCVTSIDPLLIYLYEEGLVRFATVKYDKTNKNLWNPCMHLCNYSINKYHTDYIKCDDPNAGNIGHKWTLSALLRHLRKQGRDTTALMAAIEDLVIKSILSSSQTIAAAAKAFVPNLFNCFELFGYDILIDDMLKPWLLEINLSPSLACDSPLDARVKSALLADTLTLVGLPATQKQTPNTKTLHARIGACRRVHSAENVVTPPGSKWSASRGLTRDAARVVRSAALQYQRRGGFVRIFPAQCSWQKYSQYLDPVSGIPVCSTCVVGGPTGVLPHNYNLLLHTRLLPDCGHTVHTPDRLKRYEAVTVTSTAPAITLGDPVTPTPADCRRTKDNIKQQLNAGQKLSVGSSRRAFGLFLSLVLKRLSGAHCEQAGALATLVLRFLKRAVSSLRMPYHITGPPTKMCDKDRCAVVAKQLNDFLYMYCRDTDLYTDSEDRGGCIPSLQFAHFLCSASEADLEDILLLVLKQDAHTASFVGEARAPYCVDLPPDALSRDHSLLQYLAHVTPASTRRYRAPERIVPEEPPDQDTPSPQTDSDPGLKDSLKDEKPVSVALKFAKS